MRVFSPILVATLISGMSLTCHGDEPPPPRKTVADYLQELALGAIGPAAKAAVPCLTELRDNGDAEAAIAAAAALVKITKPKSDR